MLGGRDAQGRCRALTHAGVTWWCRKGVFGRGAGGGGGASISAVPGRLAPVLLSRNQRDAGGGARPGRAQLCFARRRLVGRWAVPPRHGFGTTLLAARNAH